MKKITFYLVLMLLLSLAVSACGDDIDENDSLNHGAVRTATVTEITSTTAISGGEITGMSGDGVTARGVCWGASENPSVSDFKTSDGTGIGQFASELTELQPFTTYYIRAYAVNDGETLYGQQESFTTVEPTWFDSYKATMLEVTTVSASYEYELPAVEPHIVIASAGICWSTSGAPTIDDNRTIDVFENNSFTSKAAGLTPNTMYNIRGYVIVGEDVVYQNQHFMVTTCYDEGVSSLSEDIDMPEMAGDGMAECFGEVGDEGVYIWRLILYNIGRMGLPDNEFQLDIITPVNDMETIPDGRYPIASHPQFGVEYTSEPGYIEDDYDEGSWYYADEGEGVRTERASAVGGKGFVEIELVEGSGEMAEYDIQVEMYDTNGNKITGAFLGYILNFSASETRSVMYAPVSGKKIYDVHTVNNVNVR